MAMVSKPRRARVEAPVRRRSCKRRGTRGASSSPAADAALARAWMIALSRAALAREKPETEVSYVVLKTKS
jgi:hypothetical protein